MEPEAVAVAIEQEAAANAAEIRALEQRESAPETGAEREPVRDASGRFSSKPLDENGLRSRIDLEEVRNAQLLDQALRNGTIIPDDEMSTELWAKAFRGRLEKQRDGGSTSPPPAESRSEESAESEPEPEPEAGDQEVLNLYNQRAATFAAENPDFSDVVGALELPAHIAPAVELSILSEPNGPAIAYQLALDPALVEDLGRMTPAQAASRIGRLAEHLDRTADFRDQTGVNGLFAEIPNDVATAFERKARALQESNPLSSDELELAKAISISPQLSQTIIAMGEPALGHYLIRHPHLVPRLNQMHPFSVAAELTKIAAELDAEPDARPPKRLPVPITPTRKSVATDSGLNDSLPVELSGQKISQTDELRRRLKMGLNAAQRAELEEQYGSFYVGLFGEVLRLLDDVECRRFTANEAAALAKSRFCGLMQEHDPDCRERVTAFRERIAAERRKLAEQAAAYEEKRQAAVAGEKLRLEQEGKSRNAEIYANAREAERRQQEQWQAKYDEAEKLRRERNEKDRQTAEEAAKEGARLLTEIETSGKGK